MCDEMVGTDHTTEGQVAWSKLRNNIGVDERSDQYPYPFYETIELFRQMTRCYDYELFDACVALGRVIVDRAIFDAVTNPPLPTSGNYVCAHCGKMISGGLNGLEAHEGNEHNSMEQYLKERNKFLFETLNKKLKDFSEQKNEKYTGFADYWKDIGKDNNKEIGLKNQAEFSGLLKPEELKDIDESIRQKANVRLHKGAKIKAYEKWRKDNAEKIKSGTLEWFNFGLADKPEAREVLSKAEFYLELIIKRYENIWK